MNLLSWFRSNARPMPWRGETDPYKIWISELMLQQTKVKTVERYYQAWMDRFPDIDSLAGSPIDEIMRLVEGIGYYNRFRNAWIAARHIVERHRGRLPDRPEMLMTVPGIGPYIAAAVSSIAFNYPAGVVDGNVIRVMSRLYCMDGNPAGTAFRRKVALRVESTFQNEEPRWVNQAWMELGALICLPRPRCEACPVQSSCCALKTNRVAAYPRKPVRAAVPLRKNISFIIRDESGRVLMVQRPPGILLGLLWELPGCFVDETRMEDFVAAHHIRMDENPLCKIRHQYTHFKLQMDVFLAALERPWQSDFWLEARWVEPDLMQALAKSKATILAVEKWKSIQPDRKRST